MKFIKKKQGTLIGFHVTFGTVPGNKSVITLRHTAPYTADVFLLLPEKNRDKWYALFCAAIAKIQDGKGWVLRFDEANVCQHIGMNELARFDKQFVQYPIVVYGGTDQNSKASNFAQQQRERYLARLEKGV